MTQNASRRLLRWGGQSLLLLLTALYFWGLQRDLPFATEFDEPIFVVRAVQIASTGDWNPRWFGNPGSTIIYPLAIIYRIWFAVVHHGSLFTPDPNLQTYFTFQPQAFYIIGRLLSIYYTCLAIPIVYLIGCKLFDRTVGLIGALVFLFSPVVVVHVQIVRTDGAGLFFCVLALWFGLLLLEKPQRKYYLLTGLTIGLAVATRYFLVALLPFMLAIYWLLYRRRAGDLMNSMLGLLAVVAGFALSTPYFFLDFATAQQNLLLEARSAHLGQDGLTFWGNVVWYLTDALTIGGKGAQTILAAFGIAVALLQRQTKALLLLFFAVVFLTGIALSPLHWARWIIQILPIVALFAAFGLNYLVVFFGRKFPIIQPHSRSIMATCALMLMLVPISYFVLANYRNSNPTTRVLARHWMVENLPSESRIVQNLNTVPFAETTFEVTERWDYVASSTVQTYEQAGYDYIIANARFYEAFSAEPERYSAENAFFQDLFTNYEMVYEAEQSRWRGGPTLRIYHIGR